MRFDHFDRRQRKKRAKVVIDHPEDEVIQDEDSEDSEQFIRIFFWIGVLVLFLILFYLAYCCFQVSETRSPMPFPESPGDQLGPRPHATSPVMSDLQKQIQEIQRKVARAKEK